MFFILFEQQKKHGANGLWRAAAAGQFRIQNDVTRTRDAEISLTQEKELLETRVLERTLESKESEDYLSSIIETIRESLVVLDGHIKILFVNEHFCQFFKITEKEMVGRQLYDINGVWDFPEPKNVLENVLPEYDPFEGFEMDHDFPVIGKKLLVLNAPADYVIR